MNELSFSYNCFVDVFLNTLYWLIHEFGEWNECMEALIILMSLDYITGLLISLVLKTSKKSKVGLFNSNICWIGLMKKGAMLAVILVASELDQIINSNNYIRNIVILFFIANEGLSLLENLCVMGVPFPNIIKKTFLTIKESVNHENEDKK